ncbi:arylsulfatase [candidate division KSB1 bacterium]|nr:arylsulfatase [candidate division KSB1 bacterium]
MAAAGTTIGFGPFFNCRKVTRKPNIVFIMADDLGYGELGCYGQEKIETPNIDALAANGMRFTQFYSGAPVCAPARCVLMTGKHSGHAYIRGNDEWSERGDVWNYAKMIEDPNLEGQRPIPENTVTVGKLLQNTGYKTAIVGKWGLGGPLTEGIPNKQGFDLFYGYNCQRQAHIYYPKHLWKNTEKVWLDNELVVRDTKLAEGADPYDPSAYSQFTQKYYAPDLMFEEITNFVDENRSNPFFLYWATTIPHVSLQAPEKWVQKYVEKFGDEEPYLGDQGYLPNRYPHAAYAAMVSYLDDQIGQLVNKLKQLGLYENTIFFFTSDNGPTYAGGADSSYFESANPFTTAADRIKGSVYEGGIRSPLVACWPGRIEPGSVTDHLSAFYDVLPTLCEIAGCPAPDETDGISFVSELLGQSDQARHEFLYWEFPARGGQQAVRMGEWKAIRRDLQNGLTDIELFNLSEDIGEQNNVAKQHPEIVKKIEQIMKQEHTNPSLDAFKMKSLGDV